MFPSFVQVEVSGSDDELLTVLAKFRHTLLGIPLPPPAPVDYEQALKDAQRESIQVRGPGRKKLGDEVQVGREWRIDGARHLHLQ